jgi:hypothetical protein
MRTVRSKVRKPDGTESVEIVRVMDNDPSPLCLDCGADTDQLQEEYMVQHDVWLAAVPSGAGRLCVGCLESRLGRKLTRADFPAFALTAFEAGFPVSTRLKEAISRE